MSDGMCWTAVFTSGHNITAFRILDSKPQDKAEAPKPAAPTPPWLSDLVIAPAIQPLRSGDSVLDDETGKKGVVMVVDDDWAWVRLAGRNRPVTRPLANIRAA